MINALIQKEDQTAVLKLPDDPFTLQYDLSQMNDFSQTTVLTLKMRISHLYGHPKNYLEWRWNEMNRFEAERRFIQRMKDNYPPGTRIMLLQMGNDPRPIEPNTKGTVQAVDDMGTLHCAFDNGRSLGIVPGEDSFRKLTAEELEEEQEMTESEDFSMKMQ